MGDLYSLKLGNVIGLLKLKDLGQVHWASQMTDGLLGYLDRLPHFFFFQTWNVTNEHQKPDRYLLEHVI